LLPNKKTKIIRQIIFFVIFEFILCGFLSIMLIYHGPFENIKNTLVTTAMATMKHQYLATWFLSKEEINSILDKNLSVYSPETEDEDKVKVKGGSDDVQLIDIKTNRFVGYMLVVQNPKKVKVGITDSLGQGGMTLSQMVKKYKAYGGINAGGFLDDKMVGTGGSPTGIIIEDGKIKYKQENLNLFEIVGFNNKDVLIIRKNLTLSEVEKLGLRDAISFGPPPRGKRQAHDYKR